MVEGSITGKSVFTQDERNTVYRAIRERRDVRSGYLARPLENDILLRLLSAAHMAPSVGLMQPWRFVVVRDAGLRAAVHDNFLCAKRKAAAAYTAQRRAAYDQLRLEALLDAPQHLCVLCDGISERGHGLGRNSMPQTATYSVACAIQNLWLAARVEGIGVGWVSIVDPAAIKTLLRIPSHLELVAYLCLGYVESFSDVPDLERDGWEHREEIVSLVKIDYFDRPHSIA
jgi:5,6-dimethylbenzimidazole synthase